MLTSLEHAPNHGFGISSFIGEASEGLLRVEEGSLYPALHRMEGTKLIAGAWSVTHSGRRARVYKLTEAGKARLHEARQTWKTVAKGVKRVLKFKAAK